MSDIKRYSLRYNLKNDRDQKIWKIRQNLKDMNYDTFKSFTDDAILCYYNWIKNDKVPFSRAELEAETKRWLKEVLSEFLIEGSLEKLVEVKESQKNEPEIDIEIESKFMDYLSSL